MFRFQSCLYYVWRDKPCPLKDKPKKRSKYFETASGAELIIVRIIRRTATSRVQNRGRGLERRAIFLDGRERRSMALTSPVLQSRRLRAARDRCAHRRARLR